MVQFLCNICVYGIKHKIISAFRVSCAYCLHSMTPSCLGVVARGGCAARELQRMLGIHDDYLLRKN